MKILKTILAVGIITLISSNVSAQEITVFPGSWGEQFYQDKEKLTWKEVNEIMMESQVAQQEWQKSKKLALGGIGFALANLGSTVWLVSNLDQNKPLTGPIIAAAGTGIIGMIFFKASGDNKRRAILSYNDGLGGGTSFHLVPVNNQNGTGVALKF
ncbi:hypothetical protein LCGC14_2133920 [marine sediment metagenome]|uniref:Outer membrane protein beta-barrel domain-containing protein n=2 Tax=root TaxID=1 RepID=A0A831VSP8_9FLAO|nr:hypothetical protein [Pricia antarctica]